jgi:hypothetical protein
MLMSKGVLKRGALCKELGEERQEEQQEPYSQYFIDFVTFECTQ